MVGRSDDVAGDVIARSPGNGGANPSTNTDEKPPGSVRVPYNGVTGREEMHARAVPAKLPLLSLTRARRLTLSPPPSRPRSRSRLLVAPTAAQFATLPSLSP